MPGVMFCRVCDNYIASSAPTLEGFKEECKRHVAECLARKTPLTANYGTVQVDGFPKEGVPLQEQEKSVNEKKIKLGKRYRDTVTGFEGVAVAKHTYLHGCTRISLTSRDKAEIKEYSFDAPGLVCIETGEAVTSKETGGPRDVPSPRSTG